MDKCIETFKLFVSYFSSGTKLLHSSPREQEGSVSHSYCVTWYRSSWCDTRECWTWEEKGIFMFLPNWTQTTVQLEFLAESDFLACEQTAVATLFIYKRSETLSRRMLSFSQLWLWSILLLWAWQTAQGLQLISTQIKRTSDWQRAFEGEGWFRSCCRCDVITKLIYLDADCLEILICLVKTFPFYHIMLKLWALN